jgi:hypothetical protein
VLITEFFSFSPTENAVRAADMPDFDFVYKLPPMSEIEAE